MIPKVPCWLYFQIWNWDGYSSQIYYDFIFVLESNGIPVCSKTNPKLLTDHILFKLNVKRKSVYPSVVKTRWNPNLLSSYLFSRDSKVSNYNKKNRKGLYVVDRSSRNLTLRSLNLNLNPLKSYLFKYSNLFNRDIKVSNYNQKNRKGLYLVYRSSR